MHIDPKIMFFNHLILSVLVSVSAEEFFLLEG